jgi:hypothetical protein
MSPSSRIADGQSVSWCLMRCDLVVWALLWVYWVPGWVSGTVFRLAVSPDLTPCAAADSVLLVSCPVIFV